MDKFVSTDILETIAGCSVIVTLLTQVFKKYLPDNINTKWLALLFAIIVGVLRIVYVGQFDFAGIVSGVLNIFVLLGTSIGIYEVGKDVLAENNPMPAEPTHSPLTPEMEEELSNKE